jgi:hypothetical protein
MLGLRDDQGNEAEREKAGNHPPPHTPLAVLDVSLRHLDSLLGPRVGEGPQALFRATPVVILVTMPSAEPRICHPS